ncbi:MAG: DUF177 domain-containing protein [Chloroflexi bacterium]|nr:DUF177 domain-containing protein [Chloroflexota bacterium]
MPQLSALLRLNVGFLVNSPVGVSRDFEFDIPSLSIAPDLDLNALQGHVHVSRTAQGLLVQSYLRAALAAECVRCLSPFQQTVQTDFTELYAFSRNATTESELLLPDDMHIDLRPLVREYTLLAMPISPLCRPDCRGLCPVCGENLNETTCDHSNEAVDPRLEQLKNLLDED